MQDLVTVPKGTRLQAIVTHEHYTDVWFAVRDMAVPVYEWQGSFLRMYPNGQVTRITDDGVTYDEFIVRTAYK